MFVLPTIKLQSSDKDSISLTPVLFLFVSLKLQTVCVFPSLLFPFLPLSFCSGSSLLNPSLSPGRHRLTQMLGLDQRPVGAPLWIANVL